MFGKLLALAAIFLAGLATVFLPVIQTFSPVVLSIARNFGTGVIVSTAFLHLQAPANEALDDAHLTEYPLSYGICLLVLLLILLVDMVYRRKMGQVGTHGGHNASAVFPSQPGLRKSAQLNDLSSHTSLIAADLSMDPPPQDEHSTKNLDPSCARSALGRSLEAELAALTILEMGIFLHSIFIGVSLGIMASDYLGLACAIVFHQAFEGLGLGARLTRLRCQFENKHWLVVLYGVLFALATPIGILIGMAIEGLYDLGGTGILILNGVSDSISAGTLFYTGLVELLANDLLNSPELPSAPFMDIFVTWASVFTGAAAMALLAIWI